MLPQAIVFVSPFISLSAGFFYLRGVMRGIIKPNLVSWFIWFIAPFTAALIQFKNGVGIAALPILVAGCVPLLVILFSLWNKNASWKLGAVDYVCLICALAALVCWFIFHEGFWGTLFALLADGIGFIPTYIKTWTNPETESSGPYIAGSFNALLSLLTVSQFSFTTIGFAAYLFIGNVIEVLILIGRRVFRTM